MSIYTKLQLARVRLQAVKMTKSGKNAFAGYSYFELSDFMPHINQIFHDVGLCGIVTFRPEMAELMIHETEGDGLILITSPTADAPLKGTHPIQQLGAVQSYLRRYLWMAALEIVEHSAIDATTGKDTAQAPARDYRAELETARTLQELGSIWQGIPKAMKSRCEDVKERMKAQLTPTEEETA
jgi:hypothetical protein